MLWVSPKVSKCQTLRNKYTCTESNKQNPVATGENGNKSLKTTATKLLVNVQF